MIKKENVGVTDWQHPTDFDTAIWGTDVADAARQVGAFVGKFGWIVTPDELSQQLSMPVLLGRTLEAEVVYREAEYAAAVKAAEREERARERERQRLEEEYPNSPWMQRPKSIFEIAGMKDLPTGPWVSREPFREPLRRVTVNSRMPIGGRFYWLLQRVVYSTEVSLADREVLALIKESENKVKARVARAVALMEQVERVTDASRRSPIPDDVKIMVWQRDGGRCVTCGSNRDLEFDHIIPVTMGGANTSRNLQLLCEACNRAKGGDLV